MTNAITKAKEAKLDKPQKTLRDYIKSMEGEIKKALPSVLTPERFTRMMLSAVSNTPKLPECTPKSFLAAMMSAAQLGLEPNTPLGQAYLIPFKNKGVLEVQFQALLTLHTDPEKLTLFKHRQCTKTMCGSVNSESSQSSSTFLQIRAEAR